MLTLWAATLVAAKFRESTYWPAIEEVRSGPTSNFPCVWVTQQWGGNPNGDAYAVGVADMNTAQQMASVKHPQVWIIPYQGFPAPTKVGDLFPTVGSRITGFMLSHKVVADVRGTDDLSVGWSKLTDTIQPYTQFDHLVNRLKHDWGHWSLNL